MLTLLTGGARSGKSTAAVAMAGAPDDDRVVFVATATVSDADMRERIDHHRATRPSGWTVVEEPVELLDAFAGIDDDVPVIVDCLALWVTNRLDDDDDEIIADAESIARMLAARTGRSIVVTNEVGSGVVPATPLGRRFRDLLGTVNQRFGTAADEAYFVVAGRILPLLAADHPTMEAP